METELLTIKEVATILKVSHHTINGWIYANQIPFVKISRKTRFNKKDIEDICKNGLKLNKYDSIINNNKSNIKTKKKGLWEK